jgi:hypothetical protein
MVWSIFSGAKDYPAAVLGTEDGFVDLTLSISKYEKQKNGIARFLIKNTLDGKRIGFVIELHPTWKAQKIENVDAYFYWGSAEILSTGEDSDAFLTVLSKLYGLPTTNLTFLTRVNAQVVGLANDPANIENQPIKMKFFLNSDGPDELYSEVFVNVDLKRRVLEFNEKDPEFRGALVKSLSK